MRPADSPGLRVRWQALPRWARIGVFVAPAAGAALLMLAVALVLVFGGYFGPGTPADPPIAPQSLARSYVENQIEANDRYTGQPVDVRGFVANVRDRWEGPEVALGNFHNPFGDASLVVCRFPFSQRGELSTLQTGHLVVIRGKCQGPSGNRVLLTNCRLISDNQAPPLVMPRQPPRFVPSGP